jgi:hypothetical protein
LNGTVYEPNVTVSRPGVRPTTIGTIRMQFAYKDTDGRSSAAGPHGQPCQNGGQPVEDQPDTNWAAHFDGRYSCNCTQGYTGDNCEELTGPSQSSQNSGTDTAIEAMLGTAAVLLLAALVAFRVQIYRLKHQPLDVGGMQEEVLQSLGLAAATDIGPLEFGITLVLAAPVVLTDGFRSDLVATLSKTMPKLSVAFGLARVTSAVQGHHHDHDHHDHHHNNTNNNNDALQPRPIASS